MSECCCSEQNSCCCSGDDTIPEISTALSIKDVLGAWKVHWGI